MTTDNNAKKGVMARLMTRWNLTSTTDVILVLLVFAFTGTTVVVIKPYVLEALIGTTELSGWYSVAYYILILPVYNAILLVYGTIFGKFRFFWEFEKRFFKRMTGRGKKKE